jgi:hypothetical protein
MHTHLQLHLYEVSRIHPIHRKFILLFYVLGGACRFGRRVHWQPVALLERVLDGNARPSPRVI